MLKPLARSDIIALKQADHVIINTSYMHGRGNAATLTCVKQVDKDEFKEWEIKTASHMQFLHDSLIEANCYCQYLVYNSFINWTWQTAVGMLMPEDVLEIVWMPDAESSFPLVEAGFHCDVVKLIVFRKNSRFHYIVGVLVAPFGDTRMVSPLSKRPSREMLGLDKT